MENQILLAGSVTAVVGVAVTAMWYFENNTGSSGSYTDAKKERNKKERGKKASQMKPKKAVAAQDAPSQRAAAPPAALSAAAPAPAPKAAAPPPPVPAPAVAPAQPQGKKKGKKGAKAEEEPVAPTPPPPVAAAQSAGGSGAGKKKKNKTEAAPPAPVAPPAAEAEPKNGKKKKKDKAAQAEADPADGWCTVGKGDKAKETQKQAVQPAAMEVTPADDAMYIAAPDPSAAFFQVPVGAGGDFLQARVEPSTAPAAEQGGKKKDKKKIQAAADLHTGSNGWSPATDAMVNNVARDLSSLTIAPSPVKKVAEEDEWNTVPIKSKKKSSKA